MEAQGVGGNGQDACKAGGPEGAARSCALARPRRRLGSAPQSPHSVPRHEGVRRQIGNELREILFLKTVGFLPDQGFALNYTPSLLICQPPAGSEISLCFGDFSHFECGIPI